MSNHTTLPSAANPALFVTVTSAGHLLRMAWAETDRTPSDERHKIEATAFKDMFAPMDGKPMLSLSILIEGRNRYLSAHNAACGALSDIEDALTDWKATPTPEHVEAMQLENSACLADSRALDWLRAFPAETGEDLARMVKELIETPSKLSALMGDDCLALHAIAERVLGQGGATYG